MKAIPEMYVESENVVNLEEQHDLRASGIIKRERSSWLQAILGTAYMSHFQESFTIIWFCFACNPIHVFN